MTYQAAVATTRITRNFRKDGRAAAPVKHPGRPNATRARQDNQVQTNKRQITAQRYDDRLNTDKKL